MPNTRFITPWLCGYVSSFSYLLFTHIGKIEEFEKKLRIMTLIYSGVFIISESEAKSLFSQVSEKVPESEEFVDGSFAAEQDFNSLIISRKETYLKNYGKILITMLPIIPHFASECLKTLNIGSLIWPEYDENLIKEENIPYVIQFNGKKRSKCSRTSVTFRKLYFVSKQVFSRHPPGRFRIHMFPIN